MGVRSWPTWLAGLFLVFLELTVWRLTWGLLLSPVFAILFVFGIARYGREGDRWDWPRTVISFFSLPTLTGLVWVLPMSGLVHIYIVLAVTVFYWLLIYGLRQQGKTWQQVVTLVFVFTNVAMLFAWEYFLKPPLMIVSGVFLLIVTALSWQVWRRFFPEKPVMVLSLVLGLVLSQTYWLLLYWPIHWLAQVGVIATLYYVCFHLLMAYWRRGLTWVVYIEYLVVGSLAIGLILFTTKWI